MFACPCWLRMVFFGVLAVGLLAVSSEAAEPSAGSDGAKAAEAPGSKPAGKKFRAPDSVYVGTPHDVVMKMMELARLRPSDMVYDLGCGDGRIVVMAAKFYGCKGVGYDIDAQMVERGMANVRKHGVAPLVKIEQEDIFKLDLRPADCLLLYLLPSMNKKLVPQIQQMRPGSRIVFHDYGIEGYQAEESLSMTSQEDNSRHTIFVYQLRRLNRSR